MKTLDRRLNIVRVGSSDAVAGSALENFIIKCGEAIAERGVFYVAVSGGSTPGKFFELLGNSEEAKSVDWGKVHVFWVDERCVPPDHEESNYRLAAELFLDKVDIPSANVHRVEAEDKEYGRAVNDYESTIRGVFKVGEGEVPQFDLIFLGMGDDGHIASLFPNSYAFLETDDLVSTVYFMGEKIDRITLTHPVICAAKNLVVLVSGHGKSEIVREVLLGEPDAVKYPAHMLWPVLEKVTWIVDEAAAKHL